MSITVGPAIACLSPGTGYVLLRHAPQTDAKNIMKNNDNSQNTRGPIKRPLNSPTFSAAWGGALGVALLMISAIPSFAGSTTIKPNSVVWGHGATSTDTSDSTTVAGKFSTDLQQQPADENGVVTVIVQHRQMPSSAHLKTLQGRGAALKHKFHTIRAVAMRVPVSMLEELANDPNVTYITPDREQKMTASAATEEFATAVEADVAAATYALDGTGIGVAVIDSGIADHNDLHGASGSSRVVYSQSFVAGDTKTTDAYGHGTHVAGLIGGTGKNSGNGNGYAAMYAGVAPNVNLINLRVLDLNGVGTDSQVIAAIQQAISLKSTYNIRVISMSLGRPVFESYTLDPVD